MATLAVLLIILAFAAAFGATHIEAYTWNTSFAHGSNPAERLADLVRSSPTRLSVDCIDGDLTSSERVTALTCGEVAACLAALSLRGCAQPGPGLWRRCHFTAKVGSVVSAGSAQCDAEMEVPLLWNVRRQQALRSGSDRCPLPAAAKTTSEPRVGILAIARDEAGLDEWLLYHAALGAHQIFLYIDQDFGEDGADDREMPLVPDAVKDRVTLFRWPHRGRQLDAYADFIARRGHLQVDWLAVIDVDEFISIADLDDRVVGDGAGFARFIANVLTHAPNADAIALSQRIFTSGGRNAGLEPGELLMDTFTEYFAVPTDSRSSERPAPLHHLGRMLQTKQIARTERLVELHIHGHQYRHDGGSAQFAQVVDALGSPVTFTNTPKRDVGHSIRFATAADRARVEGAAVLNHYYYRSRVDWARKVLRGVADANGTHHALVGASRRFHRGVFYTMIEFEDHIAASGDGGRIRRQSSSLLNSTLLHVVRHRLRHHIASYPDGNSNAAVGKRSSPDDLVPMLASFSSRRFAPMGGSGEWASDPVTYGQLFCAVTMSGSIITIETRNIETSSACSAVGEKVSLGLKLTITDGTAVHAGEWITSTFTCTSVASETPNTPFRTVLTRDTLSTPTAFSNIGYEVDPYVNSYGAGLTTVVLDFSASYMTYGEVFAAFYFGDNVTTAEHICGTRGVRDEGTCVQTTRVWGTPSFIVSVFEGNNGSSLVINASTTGLGNASIEFIGPANATGELVVEREALWNFSPQFMYEMTLDNGNTLLYVWVGAQRFLQRAAPYFRRMGLLSNASETWPLRGTDGAPLVPAIMLGTPVFFINATRETFKLGQYAPPGDVIAQNACDTAVPFGTYCHIDLFAGVAFSLEVIPAWTAANASQGATTSISTICIDVDASAGGGISRRCAPFVAALSVSDMWWPRLPRSFLLQPLPMPASGVAWSGSTANATYKFPFVDIEMSPVLQFSRFVSMAFTAVVRDDRHNWTLPVSFSARNCVGGSPRSPFVHVTDFVDGEAASSTQLFQIYNTTYAITTNANKTAGLKFSVNSTALWLLSSEMPPATTSATIFHAAFSNVSSGVSGIQLLPTSLSNRDGYVLPMAQAFWDAGALPFYCNLYFKLTARRPVVTTSVLCAVPPSTQFNGGAAESHNFPLTEVDVAVLSEELPYCGVSANGILFEATVLPPQNNVTTQYRVMKVFASAPPFGDCEQHFAFLPFWTETVMNSTWSGAAVAAVSALRFSNCSGWGIDDFIPGSSSAPRLAAKPTGAAVAAILMPLADTSLVPPPLSAGKCGFANRTKPVAAGEFCVLQQAIYKLSVSSNSSTLSLVSTANDGGIVTVDAASPMRFVDDGSGTIVGGVLLLLRLQALLPRPCGLYPYNAMIFSNRSRALLFARITKAMPSANISSADGSAVLGNAVSLTQRTCQSTPALAACADVADAAKPPALVDVESSPVGEGSDLNGFESLVWKPNDATGSSPSSGVGGLSAGGGSPSDVTGWRAGWRTLPRRPSQSIPFSNFIGRQAALTEAQVIDSACAFPCYQVIATNTSSNPSGGIVDAFDSCDEIRSRLLALTGMCIVASGGRPDFSQSIATFCEYSACKNTTLCSQMRAYFVAATALPSSSGVASAFVRCADNGDAVLIPTTTTADGSVAIAAAAVAGGRATLPPYRLQLRCTKCKYVLLAGITAPPHVMIVFGAIRNLVLTCLSVILISKCSKMLRRARLYLAVQLLPAEAEVVDHYGENVGTEVGTTYHPPVTTSYFSADSSTMQLLGPPTPRSHRQSAAAASPGYGGAGTRTSTSTRHLITSDDGQELGAVVVASTCNDDARRLSSSLPASNRSSRALAAASNAEIDQMASPLSPGSEIGQDIDPVVLATLHNYLKPNLLLRFVEVCYAVFALMYYTLFIAFRRSEPSNRGTADNDPLSTWDRYQLVAFLYCNTSTATFAVLNGAANIAHRQQRLPTIKNVLRVAVRSRSPLVMIPAMLIAPGLLTHILPGLLLGCIATAPCIVVIAVLDVVVTVIAKKYGSHSRLLVASFVLHRVVAFGLITFVVQLSCTVAVLAYTGPSELVDANRFSPVALLRLEYNLRSIACMVEQYRADLMKVMVFVNL